MNVRRLATIAVAASFAINLGSAVFAAGSADPSLGASRWLSRDSGLQGQDLVDVAFGGGAFVAISAKSILRSPDGVNWAVQSTEPWGTLGAPSAVAYGNGRFVATGPFGLIAASEDGVNWPQQDSPTADFLYDIIYENGAFVAVGGTYTGLAVRGRSNPVILKSLDGMKWTVSLGDQRGGNALIPLHAIAYGDGKFLVPNPNSERVFISTDGDTWTTKERSGDVGSALAYGNGVFVGAGWKGLLSTSSDGFTWEPHDSGTTNSFFAIAFGGGTFVVVGDSGIVATSTNGSNWIIESSGTTNTLYSVACGWGTFVAVGANGTIVQSGPPQISPPTILLQPTDQTSVFGGRISFIVQAASVPPPIYRWTFNGTHLEGATNETLVLPNLTATQAGVYQAVVSNAHGSVASRAVALALASGDHWQSKSPMPIALTNPVVGFLNGSLYVVGGSPTNLLHAYDPLEDRWVSKASPSNSVVSHMYGDVIDGNLYVGMKMNVLEPVILTPRLANAIHVYDPKGDFWSRGALRYTNFLENATAVSLKGKLYVRGEFPEPQPPFPSYPVAAEIYDSAFDPSPAIIDSPQSQMAPVGSNLALSVVAIGVPIPTYQWQFEGANIPGATNATLVLTNVQVAQAGNYAVVVSNRLGSVTSQTAKLSLETSPMPGRRALRFVAVAGSPGELVQVPVELVSQGNENKVAFSLEFDPRVLKYESAALASLPNGTSLILNTNHIAQGKLGVLLALPAGQKFSAGTIQVVTVSLRIAANAGGSAQTKVTFGDQPVAREIVSPDVNILESAYSDGIVSIQSGLEADLSPRPNGDERVTASDYTLLGRIVAGLVPVADLSASEFIRADCAPRSALGDGRITASDWTQSARYVVGLESAPLAGGPGPATPSAVGPQSVRKSVVGGRAVRIGAVESMGGGLVTVPIKLTAHGNENTVAFSLEFDSRTLTYQDALSSSLPSGTTVVVNADRVSDGKLGVLLALPAGQNFSSKTYEVLRVRLQVAAQSLSSVGLGFGDEPVTRELVSLEVEVLPTQFVSGVVTTAGERVVLGQVHWSGGFGFTITGTVGKSYRIESTPEIGLGRWTSVDTTTLTNSPQIWRQPSASKEGQRFYRAVDVKHP